MYKLPMRPVSRLTLISLAMFVCMSLTSVAGAHSGLSGSAQPVPSFDVGGTPPVAVGAAATTASSAATAGLILAMVLVLAALASHSRRPRRALVLLLVVVLGVFAFHVGLHSVHHLTQQESARCALSSAGSHLAGLQVQSDTVLLPTVARADIVLAAPRPCAARAARPHDDRAPPTLVAA